MSTLLKYSHLVDPDLYNGLTHDTISFALSGDNVLVSGVAGKSIMMFRGFGVVAGDTVLTFKDGVSTNLTGAMTYFAGGSFIYDLTLVPWFQTSVGKDLILNSTNSVQVSGAIYYQIN